MTDMLSFRQKVNHIKEVAEKVNRNLGVPQVYPEPLKFVLQNTFTGAFFCEFSEHIPLDTTDINEAADFEKASDADLLMAHLDGSYSTQPKEKFTQPIKN